MKYIADALRYMFKNFIFLFAFALIPSYFFAMSVDLRSLEKIASNLLAADVDVTFATVFNSVSLINGARWPFGLVCLASMAVCMPMLLAFIEKHMRIGSRSLKGLFGRINYNFLSTVVLLLLALAVYELWALLVSGLVYASILLFDGAARFIAAVIVAAGMVLLLSYIFMQVWLWLPCLHITGYSYMDALAFSLQQKTALPRGHAAVRRGDDLDPHGGGRVQPLRYRRARLRLGGAHLYFVVFIFQRAHVYGILRCRGRRTRRPEKTFLIGRTCRVFQKCVSSARRQLFAEL